MKVWNLIRSGFSEAHQSRAAEAGRNKSGDLDGSLGTMLYPRGREVKEEASTIPKAQASKRSSGPPPDPEGAGPATLADTIAKGRLHHHEGKSSRRWRLIMTHKYGPEVTPFLEEAWKKIEGDAKLASEQVPDSTLYRMVAPGKFAPVAAQNAPATLSRLLWTRKTIVVVAALAFVLAGLFPPWFYTVDVTGVHFRRDAGYSFILFPPPSSKGTLSLGDWKTVWGIQLDTRRLLIEWACISVTGGAGWLLWVVPNLRRKI
jgi:hypothetical protein